MVRVLVTGGAGYIGSHACKRLAEAGHEPVCLDSFVTGWRTAVRFGPLVEADLLDGAAVRQAMAAVRPAAVMHFAALSQVGQSVAEPGRYWRNNLGGTLNLLEAMVETGVDALVFSSTAATYGEASDDLIPEAAPLAPVNPYGASKAAVERLIADVGRAHGLRAVVFRYFNVAGADPAGEIGERHEPETHLVPLVLEAALGRREAVTVYGTDYPTPDGTCVRDFLHVSDLADAHLLGLGRLLAGGPGLTANLGTGRGHSVQEVIACARAVTGRAIPVRVGPRRAGDPARLVCDARLAGAELGWVAARSDMASMVGDAWAWHRRVAAGG